MEITADKTDVNLIDGGDYPVSVWFRDEDADFCFGLFRHNYPDFDDGQIELMVRDQICARTKVLTVKLYTTRLVAKWSAGTAANLCGIDRVTVNFGSGLRDLRDVRMALIDIFRDLPGFEDRCEGADN